MKSDPQKLETMSDAIQYWEDCLARLDDYPDTEVAGHMVGVLSSSHFDAWYGTDNDEETNFTKLFELVSDLEVQNYGSNLEMRNSSWREVRRLLEELKRENPRLS